MAGWLAHVAGCEQEPLDDSSGQSCSFTRLQSSMKRVYEMKLTSASISHGPLQATVEDLASRAQLGPHLVTSSFG